MHRFDIWLQLKINNNEALKGEQNILSSFGVVTHNSTLKI